MEEPILNLPDDNIKKQINRMENNSVITAAQKMLAMVGENNEGLKMRELLLTRPLAGYIFRKNFIAIKNGAKNSPHITIKELLDWPKLSEPQKKLLITCLENNPNFEDEFNLAVSGTFNLQLQGDPDEVHLKKIEAKQVNQDKAQFSNEVTRPYENIGEMYVVEANVLGLSYKANLEEPVIYQVGSGKTFANNYFPNSPSDIASLPHDVIDHGLLFKTMIEKGFKEKFPELLSSLGDFTKTDAFNRESELFASISYDTRLLMSRKDSDPETFNLDRIISFLISKGYAKTNPDIYSEVVKIIKNLSEADKKFYSVALTMAIRETAERFTRKYGRSKDISGAQDNNSVTEFKYINPSYIAAAILAIEIANSAKFREYGLKIDLMLEMAIRESLKTDDKNFKLDLSQKSIENFNIDEAKEALGEKIYKEILDKPGALARTD
jgi:hypothetical protein